MNTTKSIVELGIVKKDDNNYYIDQNLMIICGQVNIHYFIEWLGNEKEWLPELVKEANLNDHGSIVVWIYEDCDDSETWIEHKYINMSVGEKSDTSKQT